MEERKGRTIRRADLILIAALLAVGLIAMLLLALFSRQGGYAVVVIDGEVCARYELSVDGTYVLNDGTNTLVISDGRAHVTNCACPDRLCERRGRIHLGGQSITCLPCRVHIYIERADEPVDLVTG